MRSLMRTSSFSSGGGCKTLECGGQLKELDTPESGRNLECEGQDPVGRLDLGGYTSSSCRVACPHMQVRCGWVVSHGEDPCWELRAHHGGMGKSSL